MNGGSGILSMLMGNKVGGIVDMVAKLAGLKGSTSSSLLKMAAPMLMGMVGRYVRKNGLGVSGLMDMLSGQKEHVQAAAPSGWNPLGAAAGLVTGAAGAVTGAAGDVVGAGKNLVGGAADKVGDVAGGAMDAGKKVVGGAANLAGKGVDAVGDVAGGAVKSGGSILRWLLPVLLLLGATGFYITQCGGSTGIDALDNAATKVSDTATSGVNAVGDVAEGAVDVAGDVAGGAMDLAKGAFGAVNDVALKALDGVEWAAGSVGSQMMDFVKGGFKGDGRFRFNNLTFASGSAAISGDSGVEVDNLAKILAAYPGAKLNIEGYTDNTGDAMKNVELSKARAESVKARLIASGVDAARLSTEGFGDANPTASNDTPEGRAENRRIEVTFMK
jgi:outer membrane protein OmpA-like peptidoglycan-associated protein